MGAKLVATWQGNQQLKQRISQFDQRMNTIIAGQVSYIQNDAVEYMKKNAPWTDRTGNARAGLHATPNFGPNFAELVLAHSVSYGIWLEIRFSGKYAIITPTMLHIGQLLMQRLTSTLEKMAAQ